jgi:hypothetical protein
MRLTHRDVRLLRWIGEHYFVRVDLLAAVMAHYSELAAIPAAGRVADPVISKRLRLWKQEGLVKGPDVFGRRAGDGLAHRRRHAGRRVALAGR